MGSVLIASPNDAERPASTFRFPPVLRAVLLATLMIAIALPAASPALATSNDADLFVSRINELRLELGLYPLSEDAELSAEAQHWTEIMVTDVGLAHSADISVGISSDWTVLGENVGFHQIPDVDELFDAFVASPAHYNNLVDPRYRFVGVAVVRTENGELWTTHRFMAIADAPDDAIEAPVGRLRAFLDFLASLVDLASLRDLATTSTGGIDQDSSQRASTIY